MPSTPSHIEDPLELLEYIDEQGVGWLHAQGYEWFWGRYIVALESVAGNTEISSFDLETLADSYYRAGDIFDFMDAPLMAIEYYHKALELDPEMAVAHREIARMYERVGDYEKMIEYSDKALALDPNEPCALQDRDGFYSREETTPYDGFDAGNLVWHTRELLAAKKPDEALMVLKKLSGDRVLRALTHCYGALGQTRNYLNTWEKLCSSVEEIDLTNADWFFMPEHVCDNSEIWKIWLDSQCRFSGFSSYYEELDNNQLFQTYSENEKKRTVFKYYYLFHSGDQFGLQRMLFKYPEWRDLGQDVKNGLNKPS